MSNWLMTAMVKAARRLRAAAGLALLLAALLPVPALSGSASLSLKLQFRGFSIIKDLTATSGPSAGQITLTWIAPSTNSVTFPLAYEVKASTYPNINTHSQFNAADPLAAHSASVPPTPLPAGTTQTMLIDGLSPGQLYCFAMRGTDSSAPALKGGWLRSVPKGYNVNNCAIALSGGRNPQTPFGVDITTAPGTATLSWFPTAAYDDLTEFNDPLHPKSTELTSYSIYRATAPIRVVWEKLTSVSSQTSSWTDTASGPEYYYAVTSTNTGGESSMSMIRSYASRDGWLVAPDNESYMHIPLSSIHALMGEPGRPDTAYLVKVSSQMPDASKRIMKTLDFQTLRGGRVPTSGLMLDVMADFKLNYEVSSASVIPSGLGAAAVTSKPENLSVFWWNGLKWLQLYGKLDSTDKTMYLQAKFFGTYQLRLAERMGGFSFNAAGVTNRFITPNGDGKNDFTVFKFDNPKSSEVSAKIFDSRGRLVIGSLPAGPFLDSLMWDGKVNGQVVPSGVYIYQIECEDQTYTGTVIIIK